ncbi:cytidyltransferase [Sulfolobales archaeon HS-7]|nr:cytidyltransferase [Sulfolobales archaeon HS-7]
MSLEEERVRKYIIGIERKLNNIPQGVNEKILSLIRNYKDDAKYYLEKGELDTALVDIAYAEGLLDALLISQSIDPESNVSKKVFVGGTFDIIHPGHIEFLREASKYGRVYVAVARDANVQKFKKRHPINTEQERLQVIASIRYVHEAFLGDKNDIFKSVEMVKPDVIVLGPDQSIDEEKLSVRLKESGIHAQIVRVPERFDKWKHSSTTSIINDILSRYRLNNQV